MEALRDLSWIPQLALPSVERLELRGFTLVLVSIPATASHHADRFRYRLLAMDPTLERPVLSVGLESDILGDYCLSVQLATEHRILARYEQLPGIEEFRERAMAEADRRLPLHPGLAAEGQSGRDRVRPRRAGRPGRSGGR